ncbi:MAG: hypothetical protein HQL91_12995 [Magnetococcales bacterium]|nr:hypothetical protein [Magnetococcales bacterium]
MHVVEAAQKSSGSGSAHLYYPDSARPFYDYQDSGSFAGRPMVIPPTVPILTQPAYFYVNSPKTPVVQAPLPTFKVQPSDAPPPALPVE